MEENLSVKKDNQLNGSNLGQSWNAFLDIWQQTGNFYFNLLDASLRTAYRFNGELLKELSNLNSSTAENTQVILDRNNRMCQNALDSFKRSFDRKESVDAETERLAQTIDYGLLAKLVAEELRKGQTT